MRGILFNIRKIGLLLFLFLSLSAISPVAATFPLKVNDVSGISSSWPMVGSLAFPEGRLKDPSAIRILSGNREIPSQVDVAATWRDGSIRWALAGFTSSPSGEYRVEYGEGIKRAPYPHPLQITRQQDGGFTVDTGAALYLFESDKLLPEKAWLVSGNVRIPMLEGSGSGVYLVDNSNRTARVSGKPAEIENKVLKEGPGRFVIKRSGWYLTDNGEKLAKAEIWMYFSAGVPYVKITHTIIFTEDTNKVWFKDYGLEFKTPALPVNVYCTSGEPGSESIKKIEAEGSDVYMMQDQYPHFAEKQYRAVTGKSSGGEDTFVEEYDKTGDWAHGDYGNFGITLVMPWLAERFPKEISFGPSGARALFWSGRCGRELDFRGKTLVEEYWQSWAEKGPGSPGAKKLSSFESNAQGSARTHDIWFLPRAGAYDENPVRKAAVAAARNPLVMADPVWLCATEAMGYPMLHKDTERFPREETLLSEYWQRFLLPLKAFPMTGFIDWGDFPTWSYISVEKRIMARFHILTNIDRYGSKREPWRLYARSGERTYHDYGHRFSRFSGDWYLIHADAAGSFGRNRGSFMSFSPEGGRLPFVWGQRGHPWLINGGDIGNWLLEYYLTGDERSFDLLHMIRESFKKNGWNPGGPLSHFHAKGIRILVSLFMMNWEEEAGTAAKQVMNSIVDMESQNGFRLFEGRYGPMYKDHRTSHNVAEYYLETGDELAKEAFLKLMDQRYRFDRRTAAATYKNYDGFTGAIAYWLTGEERHRFTAEQAIRDMLYYREKHPLPEALSKLPANPLEWQRMPDYLGIWEWHNPFIGIPTALKLIAEKGWSERKTPLAVKPMKVNEGSTLFSHENGVETRLSVYLQTEPKEKPPAPEVTAYPVKNGKAVLVKGIKAEFEKRMPQGKYFLERPEQYPLTAEHYHGFITVPAETEGGLYLLSFGKGITFTILDASADKVALYCPEGFWSVCVGDHAGSMSYGRSGAGMPAFFRVPDGLEKLELFLGRPAWVKRPDGSAAVELSKENTGRITIPVENRSGTWSIEPYIHNLRGSCPPSFFRLLNVEPVVSFGSPGLLPEVTAGKPVNLFMPLPEPEKVPALSPGITGQGLRLSKESALSFPRGPALEAKKGGYTYFPGNKGTVEFWFCPARSTYDTPIGFYQNIDTNFIKGPHILFRHRYKAIAHNKVISSILQMELLPEKEGLAAAGFQGEHYFKAGEWTHIAYTWDINPDGTKMEGDLALFVNGNKKPFKYVKYDLISMEKSKAFKLSDAGEEVVIGPFDGTMDMLRISDVVRYTESFTPSKRVPGKDINTRALFLFDEDTKGTSAFSPKPVEASHKDPE